MKLNYLNENFHTFNISRYFEAQSDIQIIYQSFLKLRYSSKELLKAQFFFTCSFVLTSKLMNKNVYFLVIMHHNLQFGYFFKPTQSQDFAMKWKFSAVYPEKLRGKEKSHPWRQQKQQKYHIEMCHRLYIWKLHFLQFITSNETINIINSRRVFHLPRHDINVQMCFIEMPENFSSFSQAHIFLFGRGWYFWTDSTDKVDAHCGEERKRLEMLVKWIALSFIK